MNFIQKSAIALLPLALASCATYRYFIPDGPWLGHVSGNDLETRIEVSDLESRLAQQFPFAEVSIEKFMLGSRRRVLIEITPDQPGSRLVNQLHAKHAAIAVYKAEPAKDVTSFQVLIYRTHMGTGSGESTMSITFEPQHLMNHQPKNTLGTADTPTAKKSAKES